MNSIKIYCIGLFAMLIMFSCNNEILDTQIAGKNVLHFETEEQMNQELSAIFKMTTEEKTKWVATKGFNSYGVQADLFYETINPESFKSEDEIIHFVNNSNYLKIASDANGEKSVGIVSGDNKLRYFVNDEMVFTVGDKAVKLIGDNTIYTCIDNLEELKSIDDLAEVQDNPDYNLIHRKVIDLKSAEVCPLEDSATPQNGNYRLVMEIYAEEYYRSSEHKVAIGYKVKSQKRTIFWFAYSTNITYTINMRAFHNYQTFSGSILPTATYIEDSGSVNDNSIEDENSWVISWPNEINANLRWGWYRVNVSTANVSRDFKCEI